MCQTPKVEDHNSNPFWMRLSLHDFTNWKFTPLPHQFDSCVHQWNSYSLFAFLGKKEGSSKRTKIVFTKVAFVRKKWDMQQRGTYELLFPRRKGTRTEQKLLQKTQTIALGKSEAKQKTSRKFYFLMLKIRKRSDVKQNFRAEQKI